MPARAWRARWLAAAAILAALPAHAANDGDLCSGVGVLLCAPLAAARAVAPGSPEERLAKAVRGGRVDELRALAKAHPAAFHPDTLLVVLASDVYGMGRPRAGADSERTLAVLDFLLDSGVDLRSPRLVSLIEVAADHASPAAADLLAHVADRGVPLDAVQWRYEALCGQDDCALLQAWLAHGANPDSHPQGEPVLREALLQGHLHDAQALLAHGADVDLLRQPPGPGGGLAGLIRLCPDVRDATRQNAWQQARCEAGRRALRFLVEHGADVNGRPSAERGCVSTWSLATARGDALTRALLADLGADPRADAACRRAAAASAPGR